MFRSVRQVATPRAKSAISDCILLTVEKCYFSQNMSMDTQLDSDLTFSKLSRVLAFSIWSIWRCYHFL